jgi:hypothetical protein
MSAMSANALLTSSMDGAGTQYWYTSYKMPNAGIRITRTLIGIKRLSDWQWIVAAPFYYYGNNINSDIYKLRDYMNRNSISYRDGVCVSFPYTSPCLR